MKLSRLGISIVTLTVAQTAFAAEGIPQMDQTWYPNQLLWLAISFLLLYALVSRMIVPTMSNVLGARDKAISSAIIEAEAAKREAESTRGDFESTSRLARAQAADMVATAQAEQSRMTSEALAKIDHELAKKSAHAQIMIEDAVSKAHGSMQAATASLASAMAEALLGSAVSNESAVDAVKKAS